MGNRTSRSARDPGQSVCVLLFGHVVKPRRFNLDVGCSRLPPPEMMRYIAPRTQEPRPQLPLECRNPELALRTCFCD